MKDSLEHLPQLKQNELKLICDTIIASYPSAHMIILFGSYARGDWKDGLHEQGRGKLTIHKKSDYDILVLTQTEYSARNLALWDKVKEKLAKCDLTALVRIIPRDIDFVNLKLTMGQYFFTEICEQGIILYNPDQIELDHKKNLDPAEEKRIAQDTLDEVFEKAKGFYDHCDFDINKKRYKLAAFALHQAVEHSYKAVLLIFGGECPQEHHLDILGDLAADYCPQLKGILPRKTEEEKELFELLDYAYIGARYDREYKITKEQLEQLAPCVKELHTKTEIVCKEKISSFV